MNVLEAIEKRRSVYSYKPEPIPEEILVELIRASHQAPSSHNLQPWEYVIVTDPTLREGLLQASPGNDQIGQAPAVVVCLGSMRQQDRLADRWEAKIPPDAPPEEREYRLRVVEYMRTNKAFRREHVVTNTYIGISFLVLAAEQCGLGTSWIGGFDPEPVRSLLQIPADYEIVALVALGWPAEAEPRPRRRRPLEEIYGFNRLPGA